MCDFYEVSSNKSLLRKKSFICDGSIFKMVVGDTPSNSLEDSNVSLKMKTIKEKGIGICSLTHSTLRVKGMCWSFKMGIRTNDKQVNYSY